MGLRFGSTGWRELAIAPETYCRNGRRLGPPCWPSRLNHQQFDQGASRCDHCGVVDLPEISQIQLLAVEPLDILSLIVQNLAGLHKIEQHTAYCGTMWNLHSLKWFAHSFTVYIFVCCVMEPTSLKSTGGCNGDSVPWRSSKEAVLCSFLGKAPGGPDVHMAHRVTPNGTCVN